MPKGKNRWHKRVSNPGPIDPESYTLCRCATLAGNLEGHSKEFLWYVVRALIRSYCIYQRIDNFKSNFQGALEVSVRRAPSETSISSGGECPLPPSIGGAAPARNYKSNSISPTLEWSSLANHQIVSKLPEGQTLVRQSHNSPTLLQVFCESVAKSAPCSKSIRSKSICNPVRITKLIWKMS